MLVSQSVDFWQRSFADLWYTVMQFLPSLFVAIAIFIIGWIVGVLLYRVVDQVVKVLRIDDALKATGVHDAARDARTVVHRHRLLDDGFGGSRP